jgi:endonuclease YncB( thermonuclease family)
LLAFSQAAQADVFGPATVVHGDTIVVAGERVRLQGVDAPELQQTCTAYGQQWACGRTSAEWLEESLGGRGGTTPIMITLPS